MDDEQLSSVIPLFLFALFVFGTKSAQSFRGIDSSPGEFVVKNGTGLWRQLCAVEGQPQHVSPRSFYTLAVDGERIVLGC
jgi:hypothetical protein